MKQLSLPKTASRPNRSLIGFMLPVGLSMVLPCVAQDKVALLVQPHGTVEIKRTGAGQTYKPLTRDHAILRANDSFKIANGSRAAIWQANRARSKVRVKDTTEVVRPITSPQGVPFISPAQFTRMLLEYEKAEERVRQPSPAEAGPQTEKPFYLLYPRHSAVPTQRPVVTWTAVPNTTKAKVTIYDSNEAEVFRAELPATDLNSSNLPVTIDLSPGNYVADLAVTARGPGGMELSFDDAQPFTVLQPAVAAAMLSELRSQNQGSGEPELFDLPYVSFCLDRKLYQYAEARLLQNLQQNPKDGVLKALLMELYWKTERFKDRESLRLSPQAPSALFRSNFAPYRKP